MLTKIFARTIMGLVFVFMGVTSVRAHPSWGIVVSSTGVVYFSDLETVWRLEPNGTLTAFRPGVTGSHVHELAIDRQNNIYGPLSVYESATRKYLTGVWRMTPDGTENFLQRPIDSVMSGVSIWRDRAGNSYSIEQNNHTKERTLLLRRTPDGRVSTVAGSAYGYADGKGVAAKFGSVYAMIIGPDENIYLTDGSSVRRVTLDGSVTTVAKELTNRNSEDKPTLFGGHDEILAGLATDLAGNVYVADAGNRRLIRIAKDGTSGVVYRCDPPYFPSGVFATADGDVYVLEFSFTPPGTTDKPRVRKISSDGQTRLLTPGVTRTGVLVGPLSPVIRSRFASLIGSVNTRVVFFVLTLVGAFAIVTILVWRINRKQRV